MISRSEYIRTYFLYLHLVKHSIDIDLHIDFEKSKETTFVLLTFIFQ